MLEPIVNADPGDEIDVNKDCTASPKCFGCDGREGCTHVEVIHLSLDNYMSNGGR
jgi:hypothetical protein